MSHKNKTFCGLDFGLYCLKDDISFHCVTCRLETYVETKGRGFGCKWQCRVLKAHGKCE